MATYVIFDRDSGEIIHTHFEPAGLETPPEEVLQFSVEPSQAEKYRVIQISDDEVLGEGLLRVDVKGKRLVSDEDGVSGAAHVTRAGDLSDTLSRKYTREE